MSQNIFKDHLNIYYNFKCTSGGRLIKFAIVQINVL